MVGLLCKWLVSPDHPGSQAVTGLDLWSPGLEGDVGPGWTRLPSRLSVQSHTQAGNRWKKPRRLPKVMNQNFYSQT